MNNKYKSALSLFSTGFAGVLTGSLLLNNPAIVRASGYDAKTPAVIERAATGMSKNDIADKLSKDFINVSRDVTPAVVTINSTKRVKQASNESRALNDPFLRQFFGQDGDSYGRQMPEPEQNQQSLGSGVIIDKNGIILTNNHVVDGADEISVTLTDKRKFKAKVIGTDAKTDLAVIRLEKAHNLPVAKLGDSSKLAVGEWVLAIGNPLGLSSTVTSGIISAKGRANVGVADFEDFIQTDAAINPGNSGGALVNLQGEVVGINTAIASKTGGYMGIGFAIPSNLAGKIMNELVTNGKVSRGYIGIQIQDLNESLAKSLDLPESAKGIVIGKVEPDSPADKAGLKIYDIITGLNGKEVNDVSSFRNEIASDEPGKAVKLDIFRDRQKIQVGLNLSELDKKKPEKIEKANYEKLNNTLGFKTEPLTPDIISQLRLRPDTNGVIISAVKGDSSAREAGLERGDVIQELNRTKITSQEDFNKVSSSIKAGDEVLLKVLRGNSAFVLAYSLG